MKILQINKFYYLRGGSEKYLFDLSTALKKQGHEVMEFSVRDSRNWPSKYEKYFTDASKFDRFSISAALKFIYNQQAVSQLKKLIADEKPDIAHLHNIAHQLTPAIIKVLKEAGVPIVQTLHDYKLVCPNYRLFTENKQCERCFGGRYYNCLTHTCMKNSRAKSLLATIEAYWNNGIKNYYNKVDLFVAPSQFMADTVSRSGVSMERVKVIYNFTDYESAPTCEQGDYLLYFGRLSDEKGIETLVRAMARLPKEKLVITGFGELYKKLDLLIQELNLQNRVTLVGQKQGEDLNKLIDKSKAVVFPSVWPENMPIALIEAMRRCKLVIASRVGGMPELVIDQKTGLLFESGNIDDLVLTIEKLRRLPVLEIAKQGNKEVEALTSEKHARLIMTVYQEVLDKSR